MKGPMTNIINNTNKLNYFVYIPCGLWWTDVTQFSEPVGKSVTFSSRLTSQMRMSRTSPVASNCNESWFQSNTRPEHRVEGAISAMQFHADTNEAPAGSSAVAILDDRDPFPVRIKSLQILHEPSSAPIRSKASSCPLTNSIDVIRAALGCCWLLKCTSRTLLSQSHTLKFFKYTLKNKLFLWDKKYSYVQPSLSATASQGSYGWKRITEGTRGFRLQKSCSSIRLTVPLYKQIQRLMKLFY